ncbi:hypothetical protein [Quatrionicoccus australiensis]|nr:hypothetical protein [Quatrionicoccus australiensis]UCV15193.1 hypothetical protein KI612_00300 [Quatrionicoccus australiensis]
MKFDIDTSLITQFLDLLKTPHIAAMVEILGILWIISRIVIACLKVTKE